MNWSLQRVTVSRDGVSVWEIPEHEARGERDGVACVVIERASWHAAACLQTSIVEFETSESAALCTLRAKLIAALTVVDTRLEEIK